MILKNRDHCPPDGFRYIHAESGYESKAIDIYTWFEDIKAHRKANRYPEITVEDAMGQLCETLPPGWCTHSLPEQRSRPWVNTRLRWRDIVEGTKAYVALIASGFQTVSQEEADRRAAICAGCFLKITPQGCGSCVKLSRIIVIDIAGKKTKHDSFIANQACGACACPLQPIVHFPLALLERADNDVKQTAFTDFCWRTKGGTNYQPEAV